VSEVPEDRMAPAMRTLVVMIPGRPPTPNNRPQNWQAAAGIADRWKDLAQHQAGLAMQKVNEVTPTWELTKTREGVPVGGRGRLYLADRGDALACRGGVEHDVVGEPHLSCVSEAVGKIRWSTAIV